MLKRLSAVCVAFAVSCGPAVAEHLPQFDANAYLDEFVGDFGVVNIGQETAYTPPGEEPPLPPVDSLIGPIGAGIVSGQFEITCPSGDETGCQDAAYHADNFDWGWGILDTVAREFVESPDGRTFFASSFANEGFTTVDIHNDQRFVHFEFALQDSGISLDPDHKYIFFAGLSDDLHGTSQVPGRGSGIFNPEESIWQSGAKDAPPFHLHQGAPTEFIDLGPPFIILTQIATSRVIPIVPEPGSLMLIIGGAAFALRRRGGLA